MTISRRALFACAAATVLGAAARAGVQIVQRLTATTRVLDVNGKAARVFGLTGSDGKPGLTLAPGMRFAVALDNQSGAPTIVHWHGQLPGWKQDGFPWPETPAIPAGQTQAYDFAPIPGTFWMHSHQGMQEQQLMTAPLIVQDAASQRGDVQEVVIMLHDFSFRTPDEILARLTAPAKPDAMMQGMGMAAAMRMPGMVMSGKDLNDVNFDAFLANDRTLDDPELVRVAPGQMVRLRFINGASSTNFWIDLRRLSGRLVAVDGHDVAPLVVSRFPLAMAQRADVLLRMPAAGSFPVLAQVEGKIDRTGIVLATQRAAVTRLASAAMPAPAADMSLERRLTAAAPLTPRGVDRRLRLVLNGTMGGYVWTLNGKRWPQPDVLHVDPGQRVLIDMVNASGMSHPMHLHGHTFQVVAIDGQALHGAMRDTVLVPAKGQVTVAFDANNPGRWALHCHNLYHMMTGMMTELRYPGIV